MVTKQISKHPKSIVDVQITKPWAEIAQTWDQTLAKLAQDVEMPGFRKGQAPANMVEGKIGQQLQQEVLKVVMPQALIEALQGTDVVPIDYPQYQVLSFAKGQDLTFRATVTQRPIVQIGNYKGIRAAKPEPKPVSKEEVDKVIDDLYKRWKSRQPAQPEAAASEQAQAPASQQGASGSLSFNKSTQGAAPAVTSDQLTSTQPDDNFAKAVGAANMADLTEKVKKDLEDEAKYNNELDYEEAILQEVEKVTQVDIPEVLIQDELNRMLVSLQRRVADMGLLLDDYLRSQSKSLDQIKNEWRPQAEKNVRMELGLAEIARLENVNISDADLQAEIDKIQDARTKQQFDFPEPRMHLRHALRQTKTLNLLKTLVQTA